MSTKYVDINSKTGQTVTFNRQWGKKTFSDAECEKLANGEEITFMHTDKNGNDILIRGKLATLTFNGKSFVGFTPSFANNDAVPNGWCGVVFSDKEKADLAAGKSITRDDFISKSGRVFKATLAYTNGKFAATFDDNKTKSDIIKENRPQNTNSFVNDLFNASNAVNNKNTSNNTNIQSFTNSENKKQYAKIKLVKTEVLLDCVKLTYSNNVIVYITKDDYGDYYELIELSTIDEVIKEYATDVDTSNIIER